MSIPRLSVLMTSYNSERFLSAAIVSILEQTFTDFEFIVVDDGSTDKSASIIRSFSARDSRVRGIFLDKNVGIPRAANIGLREVRAPLVARMDSDDICDCCRLAKQVSYMDKHSDIYMLGCRAVNIDEIGNKIEEQGFNKIEGVGGYKIPFAMGCKAIAKDISRGEYPLLHATLVYRTSRVLALGGYREIFSIGEDLDLYERMLVSYGSVFSNLSNVLYFYRRYLGSATSIGAKYNSKKQYWIKALICYSSDCVRQGLSDPLAVVKVLSFPPLIFPKDDFNIIELLFYLHVYRKLLLDFPSPCRNFRRLQMIRAKISHLPKSSKTRQCLGRRFFLLLLPIIPRAKDDREDFLQSFDDALFNRDGFLYNMEYSNLCLVVARGCLGFGEWKYFMRYMFISFRIDFIFTLYFFYVRALAHLRRLYV